MVRTWIAARLQSFAYWLWKFAVFKVRPHQREIAWVGTLTPMLVWGKPVHSDDEREELCQSS